MRNFSKVHHNSKVIPLRWVGNFLGEYAGNHLVKAVYLDEDKRYGWRYKYHAKAWKYLNKPYEWWGTYYTLDIKLLKESLEGEDDVSK